MNRWGLIGGSGFIGRNLARSILSRRPGDEISLLDIRSPVEADWNNHLPETWPVENVSFIRADVRNFDELRSQNTNFDVIVNLAAIHREPGHHHEEYFETNVRGAENVCKMAEITGCREIVFTSSIAVYGVHDRPVDEYSGTQPRTPYGQSKLKAESIHRQWAAETGGRLSIIRPGVVFGPGEAGNVTRLVHEMLNRKRAIYLNPDQQKAGIYIEELIQIIHWLRAEHVHTDGIRLVNGVSSQNLSFNSFGHALQKLKCFDRSPIRVSARALGLALLPFRLLTPIVPPTFKLHPKRLAKLLLANDVRSTVLNQLGYPFSWPVDRALADWMQRGL